MRLYLYPLAMMVGGVIGTIAHEGLHALAAMALGQLEDVGWQGGIGGGPYVDYRAGSRAASEVIRKAPLVAGVCGAIALVVGFDGLTLTWTVGVGVVWGLLWSSPEDLFIGRARESAA
jgi:hypothetical protein